MKVLLLSDRKSAGNAICDVMRNVLKQAGHEVQALTTSCEELRPCFGCFGCWVKTPGQCVITNDDANRIAMMMMRADAVVLLSEITYGGFFADIKTFLDRSIQNILPFFEMHEGKMHHLKRYERFPTWIAVGCGNVSEPEKRTFLRLKEINVLNMRPRSHLALAVRNGEDFSKDLDKILKLLEEASA